MRKVKKLGELELVHSEKHIEIIKKILREHLAYSFLFTIGSCFLIYIIIESYIYDLGDLNNKNIIIVLLSILIVFLLPSLAFFITSIQKKVALMNNNVQISYAIGKAIKFKEARGGNISYIFLIHEISENTTIDMNLNIIGANRLRKEYKKRGIEGIETGTLKKLGTTNEVHKTISFNQELLLVLYDPNSIVIDFELLVPMFEE